MSINILRRPTRIPQHADSHTVAFARILALAALPLAAICLAAACGQQADAEDATSERTAQDTATDAAPARSEPRHTHSPTPDDARPNAADEYRRIWAQIDDSMDITLSESLDNPTREAEEILNDTWEQYEALVEATKLEHCDWGIDYGEGFDTLLPHLPYMRRLARYLSAHASSAVRWTDMDRARDATLSLIRMSRHIRGDFVIEYLVAVAVLHLGLQEIIDHKEEWRAADREALLDELRLLDPDDPLDLASAVEFDRRMAAEQELSQPEHPQVILSMPEQTGSLLREAIEALER